MILFCSGWGSRPTYGSRIHIVHVSGVWQPLYAVDGRKDPLSLFCPYMCVTVNPVSLIDTIPLCSSWGSIPATQIHYQIHGTNICFIWCGSVYGLWWPRFSTSAEIMEHWWATTQTIPLCREGWGCVGVTGAVVKHLTKSYVVCLT